jgi:hypothetical protein
MDSLIGLEIVHKAVTGRQQKLAQGSQMSEKEITVPPPAHKGLLSVQPGSLKKNSEGLGWVDNGPTPNANIRND